MKKYLSTYGLSLTFALVALLSLVFLTTRAGAAEVTGKVNVSYRNLFLLITEEGEAEIGILQDMMPGVGEVVKRAKETGYPLRVGYQNDVAGVHVVHALELQEPVELYDPALRIRTTQLITHIQKKDPKLFLVDLRAPGDYKTMHLPMSVSIPWEKFETRLLPADKSSLVVFYGSNYQDERPQEAAKRALEAGYENVRIVEGGIRGWIDEWLYVRASLGYVSSLMKEGKRPVFVDTREAEEVEAGHIPGAVHARVGFLSYDNIIKRGARLRPIVFYGSGPEDLRADRQALMAAMWRYGDFSFSPVVVLDGGLEAWRQVGLPVEEGALAMRPEYLDALETPARAFSYLRELWEERPGDVVILDVRSRLENHFRPVERVNNIPVDELPFRLGELERDRKYITFCSRGNRARMAYHILRENGYRAGYIETRVDVSPEGEPVLY